jgi:predicted esterase
MEGAQPSNLAKLLANMKPPVETPDEAATEIPGTYQLEAPSLPGDPKVTYFAQLPPEYDPYRRYPCIISLHGAGTSALQQIDWWAGNYSEQAKMRLGQASRHGYIVLAPAWAEPNQYKYNYSAREHAAVLYTLLDACRRFNIDVDRVFLSGHSMGGDAAWDIGLAHPHMWAGILPVVAKADKYVERYWENGRRLPMYFVTGEMDGNKIAQNAPQWNRYLNKHTYNVVVVEYQGRGHEHFHDEIQRMFDWMKLTPPRNLLLDEFEAYSLRPWDNVFWWAEVSGFPERSTVVPVNWDTESGAARPGLVEGRITERKRVVLKTAAAQATVWLSPDMVDFASRVSVSFNGRSQTVALEPGIGDLLEDARTRCDRQHPFWVRLKLGRAN